MRSGSEEGSYLRLVDFYITHLLAESNEEEEEESFTLLIQPPLGARTLALSQSSWAHDPRLFSVE